MKTCILFLHFSSKISFVIFPHISFTLFLFSILVFFLYSLLFIALLCSFVMYGRRLICCYSLREWETNTKYGHRERERAIEKEQKKAQNPASKTSMWKRVWMNQNWKYNKNDMLGEFSMQTVGDILIVCLLYSHLSFLWGCIYWAKWYVHTELFVWLNGSKWQWWSRQTTKQREREEERERGRKKEK